MDYLRPVAALIPGARGAVLEVLARASRGLSLSELSERAGVSRPHVGREVQRLEGLGVITRTVVGASHQVVLSEGAIGDWIRELADIDQWLWTFLRRTAEDLKPWVLAVVVFGSFARGTARPDSDIDVLVVINGEGAEPERFEEALARWVDGAAAFSGNPVAEIVMTVEELRSHIEEPVWRSARDEGVAIHGPGIAEVLGRAPVA